MPGDGEGRRASGAPAPSCSPSLSFPLAPPWTNSYRSRCFRDEGWFSCAISEVFFFFQPIWPFTAPRWKWKGKRRAGSPLLAALDGRGVTDCRTAVGSYFYAGEIYESKRPEEPSPPPQLQLFFKAVRKLLAANQSSRADTPRRNPPLPPARFEATCGELIHRCGGRLTATSSEPPYPPHAPPPLPPPPVVAISFQAPLALWRRGQTGKCVFFPLRVCVCHETPTMAAAASVMGHPRVCVGGLSPWPGQTGTPPPQTLPFQAASWPSSTGNGLLGS